MLCLGGLQGASQGPPGALTFNWGTLSNSPIAMKIWYKVFTVIKIIFAEKFVSQEVTIRAAPGLSGPTNRVKDSMVFF